MVVPLDLQRRSRAHETTVVERQIRVAEHRQRGGPGDPERQVGVETSAAFQADRVRLDRDHPGAEDGLDAAPAGSGFDPARERRVIAGQDAVARFDDGRRRFESAVSESSVDAEGQLDPAGAAADDDHVRTITRQGFRPPLDHRRQAVDRAGWNRVLADAGKVEGGHGGAHVEGGQVEGERFAALDEQPAGGRFDPGAWSENHPDACPARQRHGVDLQFVTLVLAGYEPRRHPGVDGNGRVDDQCGVDGGVGFHDPVSQQLDMCMAGAHEDHSRGRMGRRTWRAGTPIPVERCGRHVMAAERSWI